MAALFEMGTQFPLSQAGTAPGFSPYVYCGQTAGWIKMPLCTKVGLGPYHIVLDGDTAPPKKGHRPTIFWPIFAVAKLSPSYC